MRPGASWSGASGEGSVGQVFPCPQHDMNTVGAQGPRATGRQQREARRPKQDLVRDLTGYS